MMKTYLISGLLLMCLLARGQVDSLFTTANQLYQNGQFEESLSAYGNILERGLESADLYYNLGNAAFRSNNIGYSILYYEKALKMDPGHQDASHNLEFVEQYRIDTFDEVPELFLKVWRRALVTAFPEQSWSILAFVCFLVILLGMLIYLFSTRLALKKGGFFGALVGLLLFLLAFSSAVYRHRQIKQPESAIVLSPSVIVRSSPSDTGTELFILHEGTKVRIFEEVSGWRNVRVIDGREGWIESGDYGDI